MDVSINYLAVVVAAVVQVLIGWLWYGTLFGKQWKKMMGFTDEHMRSMKMKPGQAMLGGFVSALVMAGVLSCIITYVNAYTLTEGVMVGARTAFWLWLGFAAPITLGPVLWERRPFRLWYLNAGFYLIALVAMGSILGALA